MTGIEVDVETQARQIAARGREALVERLRVAYGDAAAAHADVISLDDGRIEAMVQAAADRADGLQWRRALAAVAAEELGIGATEALSHPAVLRAQALVGAPSYEQSLAELVARPVPPPAAATTDVAPIGGNGAGPAAVGPPVALEGPHETASASGPDELETASGPDELETVEADDIVLELLPEPDPIEYETEVYDVEASFSEAGEQRPAAALEAFAATEEQPVAPDPEPFPAQQTEPSPEGPAGEQDQLESAPAQEEGIEVSFAAVHLGGVANLPTKREGLTVRLSSDGLDIMQGARSIIGRLIWDEIEALEVPNLRVRRRQKQVRARLVVRTPHGDASFEVPEVSADELRDRVEPLMRLYGGD